MKKVIVFGAVMCVLCGLVFAGPNGNGAVKVEFAEHGGNLTGIHENANGFMVINKKPEGAVDVTIQIQIRDAAPSHEYAVYSTGKLLGVFTTNKKGSGSLHVNLADESALGTYVNIWSGVKPSTRLMKALIP